MGTSALSPQMERRKFIYSQCMEFLFSEYCSHIGGFIFSVLWADKRASKHKESLWKICTSTAPTSWRPETAAQDAFAVSSLAGPTGC